MENFAPLHRRHDAGDDTKTAGKAAGHGPVRHSAGGATTTWNAREIAVATQNLIDLELSDERLRGVDEALASLESLLDGLAALDAERRRSLRRMGGKSEAFCRQTLIALEQNPQVVPPSLKLPRVRADLDTLDRLRPRLQRLQRLTERAQDSETLLGSDVMMAALQGYALLKVAGKNQGLDGLRKELGTRFNKSPRAAASAPASAAATAKAAEPA